MIEFATKVSLSGTETLFSLSTANISSAHCVLSSVGFIYRLDPALLMVSFEGVSACIRSKMRFVVASSEASSMDCLTMVSSF